MADPELLLLDEPAAGLDLAGREDLLRRIDDLADDDFAPTVVMVTHHVEEVPGRRYPWADAARRTDGRCRAVGGGADLRHDLSDVRPAGRGATARSALVRTSALGMTTPEILWLFLAGFAAGGVNAAVGSGTLITFPTCWRWVSRRCSPTGRTVWAWFPAASAAPMHSAMSSTGGCCVGRGSWPPPRCGALLVLVLPSAVFAAAVPWLILLAVVLVALQPLVVKHLPDPSARTGAVAMAGSGFYGGTSAQDRGSRSSLHCPRAGCGRSTRPTVRRTYWLGWPIPVPQSCSSSGAGGVDGGGGAGGLLVVRRWDRRTCDPPDARCRSAQPGHRGRSDRGRLCVRAWVNMPVFDVDALDDPRLNSFTGLTDMQMRMVTEPAAGIFLAEGRRSSDAHWRRICGWSVP